MTYITRGKTILTLVLSISRYVRNFLFPLNQTKIWAYESLFLEIPLRTYLNA